MALSTYAELQASVLDWMKRASQSANAPDWITLAEARLNRELGPVETDASRTGTVDSRVISISALTIVQPIALWFTEAGGGDERPLQMQSAGNMAYVETSGRPRMWCVDSTTSIKLDRPCDTEYAFRFRFRERFALSDSSTTNWLLTNHPDIYLAASLMWGGGYNEDWPNGSVWKSVLDEAIPQVKHVIAQSKRGMLRTDPALNMRRRATYAELANGS